MGRGRGSGLWISQTHRGASKRPLAGSVDLAKKTFACPYIIVRIKMQAFNELRPTSFYLPDQLLSMFIKFRALEDVMIKRLVNSTAIAGRAGSYANFVEKCFKRHSVGEDPHHDACLFPVKLSK